jgi:hypothetical protein
MRALLANDSILVESIRPPGRRRHAARMRLHRIDHVSHRVRQLAQGGPAELFADLHPGVAWADDHLDVTSDRDATIELEGRGLVVMPSAFQWARPATIDLDPGNRP